MNGDAFFAHCEFTLQAFWKIWQQYFCDYKLTKYVLLNNFYSNNFYSKFHFTDYLFLEQKTLLAVYICFLNDLLHNFFLCWKVTETDIFNFTFCREFWLREIRMQENEKLVVCIQKIYLLEVQLFTSVQVAEI